MAAGSGRGAQVAVDALIAAALTLTFLAGIVILALPADLRPDWWAWYMRYMGSGQWRRLRARVLRRDNWTFQRCGANEEWHMQAHHLPGTYRPWWWYALRLPESQRNLVTLCEECHRAEHGKEE